MSKYTLYNETLPDYKKYSYTYLDAETLQRMDEGAALAPSKLRLENYRQETGIIDAVDIDWQGIRVGDVEVESTGHLAYLISQKSNSQQQIITGDGIGIPVLDKDKIDELTSMQSLPDKYISVPNPNEIADETENKIYYQNSGNGYYLDILFSSIRKLQSEVAKLRNSFKYGIYSYNDEKTAMSTILDETHDIENEPLWATEESDLSEIDCGLYLTGIDNGLETTDGSTVTLIDTDTIQIDGTAIWTDANDVMKNDIDTKQYIFMTSNTLNLKITLKSLDAGEDIVIDLSQLNVHQTASNRYNILFILSRSYKDTKTNEFNDETFNYVWLSISDYLTGVAQVEGYYENNELHATRKIISATNNRYYIQSCEFNDIILYKFNTYTKKQDFSNTVVPSPASTDDDYKYSVAHITVRSVKNLSVLNNIKQQLPKNELIYVENINTLYIKTDSGVKPISGGSNNTNTDTDTGMEKQQIIDWLLANGIIVTDKGGKLQLNDVSDITFIHEETGKRFKFKTDATGELRSTEIEQKTLADRVVAAKDFDLNADNNKYIRGFVGTLRVAESTKRNSTGNTDKLNVTGDVGLLSDRVKIAQIYMPTKNQIAYGCSHAFIELENTSDKDFQLDGCYLHFAQNSRVDTKEQTGVDENNKPIYRTIKGEDNIRIYHLALDGKIPAGGTYLIRGKQYCDFNEANVFIKVETYDKEWYVDGELIDLTRDVQNTFLMTYGLPDITQRTAMFGKVEITADEKTSKYTGFNPHYIDSISVGIPIDDVESTTSSWDINAVQFENVKYDAVFKNVYELDPAKQAYQSLFSDKKDSSRVRGQAATDFQILDLRSEYIDFPGTEYRIPMSIYTPRASFEHKNVCTDKTQLNMLKPNMLSVSFGIDIYKTRCFNWISAGVFDEYIWIRKSGSSKWYRYESYKSSGEYNDDPSALITRKTYSQEITDAAYSRIINTLPASEIVYTAHKLILNIGSGNVSTPTTYEYVAGRADKNGNIDKWHCSQIQRFTIYPKSYKMRIYQHTDQQGFQWIEYQAWTGAAQKMMELIDYDVEHEQIIPILINTGDMTQNGTRINEWIDYYEGGKCLFEKYEQLAVVGNNDLCDTNINILGTGDDTGKSNGYYFHIANCYEMDADIPFIVNGKYLPSTYYVCGQDNAIVCIDSEFTMINCRDWYNLKYNEMPVNIYTGYTIQSDATNPIYAAAADKLNFEPVYNKLYKIFNKLINTMHYAPEDVICACHEMPFTVVTNANLKNDSEGANIVNDRCLNGTSLVGSHMNRMNSNDKQSLYWFSRLIESFGIKLMIGGHKHTYMCTWPLRENYRYDYDSETQTYLKNSINDGPMTMPATLENDNVSWLSDLPVTTGNTTATKTVNTSKFPIIYTTENKNAIYSGNDTFYPVYNVSDSYYTEENGYADGYPYKNKGIIYFMLQATGAKLKSNKELPSQSQTFGYIIPKTKHESATSDKPYADQQYPMFAKIDLDNRYIVLCRVTNVLDDASHTITQQKHGNGDMKIDIAYHEPKGTELLIYGNWRKNIDIAALNATNALVTF